MPAARTARENSPHVHAGTTVGFFVSRSCAVIFDLGPFLHGQVGSKAACRLSRKQSSNPLLLVTAARCESESRQIASREVGDHTRNVEKGSCRTFTWLVPGISILFGYLAMAAATLRSPLLREGARPLLVAHRAGAGEAPENTLESLKYCMDLQVPLVQMDVMRTKDGQLVLFHDVPVEKNLEKLTDRDRIIEVSWKNVVAVLQVGRYTNHILISNNNMLCIN
eukprot:s849_g15.t1